MIYIINKSLDESAFDKIFGSSKDLFQEFMSFLDSYVFLQHDFVKFSFEFFIRSQNDSEKSFCDTLKNMAQMLKEHGFDRDSIIQNLRANNIGFNDFDENLLTKAQKLFADIENRLESESLSEDMFPISMLLNNHPSMDIINKNI